jgi:cyclopropane fatty-acyl-phospholipid synthase-like methyltransferase
MSERQAAVDNYFEKRTSYWKTVYEERDPSAIVFQQRQHRTLRWARELRLEQNSEILDVGCGAGLTAVSLAQLGYRVHAVDHVSCLRHGGFDS